MIATKQGVSSHPHTQELQRCRRKPCQSEPQQNKCVLDAVVAPSLIERPASRRDPLHRSKSMTKFRPKGLPSFGSRHAFVITTSRRGTFDRGRGAQGVDDIDRPRGSASVGSELGGGDVRTLARAAQSSSVDAAEVVRRALQRTPIRKVATRRGRTWPCGQRHTATRPVPRSGLTFYAFCLPRCWRWVVSSRKSWLVKGLHV